MFVYFETPKIRKHQFLYLFCSNSHHVLFFEMPDFDMFVYFEMPNFRISLELFDQNEMYMELKLTPWAE